MNIIFKLYNVVAFVALWLLNTILLCNIVSGQETTYYDETSQQSYSSRHTQHLEKIGLIESIDHGITWEFKGYAQFHMPHINPVDPSVLYDNGELMLYIFDLQSLMTDTSVVYLSVATDIMGLDFSPPVRAFEFKGFLTDPAVVKLSNNMYKMYVHSTETILSATSSDGTSFTLDPGERANEGGIPGVLLLPDGKVRLFVCGKGITSLISDDGMTFTLEPGVRIPIPDDAYIVADPHPIMINDGTYRMAYKVRPAEMEGPPIDDEIYLAESVDGFSWTPGSTPLVKGSNPTLVELPDGRWRIYYVDFSEASSIMEEHERIPEKFHLEQNYPNPFNPATTIKFCLLKRQHTILKVYNPLGQEVALLCNEVMGPGKHTIVFNANELNSGLYFYSLQGVDFTETKKFVVLK